MEISIKEARKIVAIRLDRNDFRYGNLHSDDVHKLMETIANSQRWLDDVKSNSSFRPTLYGIVWHRVSFDDEVKSLIDGQKPVAIGRQEGEGEKISGPDEMEVDD
ncbi:hypothetical protein Fcan01_11442 [Folsomia candida]|uniref:Uncharacterized protein n=2 Tax=Folsomia candida TaxID=158441 RepID=A0A226ED57_FOLCA|nr:hypothetical protein Fcan01_11442 [Folsomia candida]